MRPFFSTSTAWIIGLFLPGEPVRIETVYSVNGERRSFALLRPITDTTAQGAICDVILAAYAEVESAPGVQS